MDKHKHILTLNWQFCCASDKHITGLPSDSLLNSLSITCDRSVVFSCTPVSPRYNWNIVESGVKHHNPKPNPRYCTDNMLIFFFKQNRR